MEQYTIIITWIMIGSSILIAINKYIKNHEDVPFNLRRLGAYLLASISFGLLCGVCITLLTK